MTFAIPTCTPVPCKSDNLQQCSDLSPVSGDTLNPCLRMFTCGRPLTMQQSRSDIK